MLPLPGRFLLPFSFVAEVQIVLLFKASQCSIDAKFASLLFLTRSIYNRVPTFYARVLCIGVLG